MGVANIACIAVDLGGGLQVSVMAADPTVDCASAEYAAGLWVSAAMLLVVGAGAPLLFVGAIVATSRLTCEGDFECAERMFTFATGGYRLWYWEGVAMLRKALVVVAVAAAPAGMMQLVVPTWVLGVLTAASIALHPWEEAVVQRVEAASLCTILVTYGLVGLTFFDAVGSSDALLTAVVALVASVNLLCFAVFLYAAAWGMRLALKDAAEEDHSFTALYSAIFEPSPSAVDELRTELSRFYRRLRRDHVGAFIELRIERFVQQRCAAGRDAGGRCVGRGGGLSPHRHPTPMSSRWGATPLQYTHAARLYTSMRDLKRSSGRRRVGDDSDNIRWEANMAIIDAGLSTWSSEPAPYSVEPGSVFYDDEFFGSAPIASPDDQGDACYTGEPQPVAALSLPHAQDEVHPFSIEYDDVDVEDVALPHDDGAVHCLAPTACRVAASAGPLRNDGSSGLSRSDAPQGPSGRPPPEELAWAIAAHRWLTAAFLHHHADGAPDRQLCRDLDRLLRHRAAMAQLWRRRRQ